MNDPLVQLRRSRNGGGGQQPEKTPKRVLIMLMPWATPEFPGLGPALIRSILIRDGIECDIVYGNLIYSKLVGGDPFIERQLSKVPMSEVAFTPYYFTDMSFDEAAEHLHKYIKGLALDPSVQRAERFPWLVERAGVCLDELFKMIEWEKYDVVGFSVMMQQTVASLALTKRIKESHPHIRVIFGGPNTSRPMGEELLKNFPEIDFVVEGEADGVITDLVREIRSPRPDFGLPGVVYRDAVGAVRQAQPGIPFHDLSTLPIPDFTPFFEQLGALGLTHVQPSLQIETSRGCWWGEKHHCTFCGIDDVVMKFRSKTEEQVLNEVMTLSALHQQTEFFVVDSIISHRFFKTLLPQLGRLREQLGYDLSFFFECKSNLRREHVRMFRHAGVTSVQPGIESFNDHVLQLMDKGNTGARQIQCLRLLAEYDIVANWNLIYQNQFETAEDYRDMLKTIPYLHHIPPLHDEGLIPIQLNRFAPNHIDPARYGITNVRPKEHYKIIFPKADIDMDRMAFYFDFDAREQVDPELKELYLQLQDEVELWRRCYREHSLVQHRGPGFVQIVDRRVTPLPDGTFAEGKTKVTTLEAPWSDIFVYCDEVRGESEVLKEFAGRASAEEIQAFLDGMVAERLIYRSVSAQLISLPLLKVAKDWSLPKLEEVNEYDADDSAERDDAGAVAVA